jgi:hypothetical protein
MSDEQNKWLTAQPRIDEEILETPLGALEEALQTRRSLVRDLHRVDLVNRLLHLAEDPHKIMRGA